MDKKKTKKQKFPSELRFDLVSKDWVVIATGRARKPESFKKEKRKQISELKGICPFCDMKNQEKPVLVFRGGKMVSGNKIAKDWTTVVVPNKYPAFLPYPELEERKEGEFYQKMNAAGFHEVVITRDHNRTFGDFSLQEVKEVFDVYQKRYQDLMGKKFVNHVSIFHNQGEGAGASIAHTHSQIVTTPLIDVDLKRALSNSENYFKNTGKCIYCQMSEWERKVKKRVVFENKLFVVICPFASKSAFQAIVTPKFHSPYFEKAGEDLKRSLAEAFSATLKKMAKGLNNPDFNFYLHTAPCDEKEHPFYHWHWTILPKTSTLAGFEMGSKMEISTIEPEKAAKYLRKQKI